MSTPALRPEAPDALASAGRVALIGLFTLAVGYTLYFAASLVVPLVFAIYLALLCRPLVRWLARRRIPAPAAAALVLLTLTGGIAFGLWSLAQPAVEWAGRWPEVVDSIEARLWPVKQTIEEANRAGAAIAEAATVGNAAPAPVAVQQGPSFLEQAVGFTGEMAAQILLTLVLAFFLLADGGAILTATAARYASARAARVVRACVDRIEGQIGRYLFALLLINAGVGLLTMAAFFALGMPNAPLWGAVAAILGLVPYVGPLVTIVIFAVAGMLSFDDWTRALAPVAAYAAINYLEGEVVTPLVVGRTLSLSPVLVFVSVVTFTWLWGPVGALLAVPILVVARVVIDTAAAEPEDRLKPMPLPG